MKLTYKILCTDVLSGLKTIPDESIDCIVTSPPYWGLRDYGQETNVIWDANFDCEHEFNLERFQRAPSETGKISKKAKFGQGYRNYESGFCKKCGAWYGQLGLEPTLDMYLEHLLQIMKELKRVLKKTGVIYWNHGDSYASPGTQRFDNHKYSGISGIHCGRARTTDYPAKCMLMQNYRLIIRAVDKLGLILRNIIIWEKPNAMPSSVEDRLNNRYEPVFMLVKNKKYWFDLDAIREPHKNSTVQRSRYETTAFGGDDNNPLGRLGKGIKGGARRTKTVDLNPLGKNPGDIFHISTEPFSDAHFATFPTKLVKILIETGCPQWICSKCGKARERITRKEWDNPRDANRTGLNKDWRKIGASRMNEGNFPTGVKYYTMGWTDCGCNADWDSGVVLDPFLGSGTTMLVAKQLNRSCIGIEINPKYCEMAKRRVGWYEQKIDMEVEYIYEHGDKNVRIR